MQKLIIPDEIYFQEIINNIKKDSFDNLYFIADFDCTITHLFTENGEKIHGLMVALDFIEDGLPKEALEELKEIFLIYYPIEINPNIDLEEKKLKMVEWWELVFEVFLKYKINENILQKVANLEILRIRKGFIELINFLNEKNIPLLIFSATGLGIKGIEFFLKARSIYFPNTYIVSNDCEWDKEGIAISYKKPTIHSFNKNGFIIKNHFPKINEKIINRKNIILIGDSLGDHHMVDGLEYENLLKIGFLNHNEEENLNPYLQRYDIVLTGDNDFNIWKEIFK